MKKRGKRGRTTGKKSDGGRPERQPVGEGPWGGEGRYGEYREQTVYIGDKRHPKERSER